MIDFNNLTEVNNVNTRIDYDMRYSAKTGKFTVSNDFFAKYNLQDNGFKIFNSNGTVVFKVVPNEDAEVHKGKSKGQKGYTFTANTVAKLLGVTESVEINLQETVHNGDIYFAVTVGEVSDVEETTSDIIAEEVSELVDDIMPSFAVEEEEVESNYAIIN